MKLLSIPLILMAFNASAQDTTWLKKDWEAPKTTESWGEKPRIVTPPVKPGAPPSDAIVIFDGTNTDSWLMSNDSQPCAWKIYDSVLVVKARGGDIQTKQQFGDCQIHLEFKIPADSKRYPRDNAGNSGVLLQERYELQIFDSYLDEVPLYTNGQCASIYKQTAPLVNACSKPGEWNSYDIIYTAPAFHPNGAVEKPAYITLLHNGVLVLNHFEIQGSTKYTGFPVYEPHGKAALRLQDHHSAVGFRNIWIRNL